MQNNTQKYTKYVQYKILNMVYVIFVTLVGIFYTHSRFLFE